MENNNNLALDLLRRATTKEGVLLALTKLNYNTLDEKIFALKKASNESVRYCATFNPNTIINEDQVLNEQVAMFLSKKGIRTGG